MPQGNVLPIRLLCTELWLLRECCPLMWGVCVCVCVCVFVRERERQGVGGELYRENMAQK